MKFYFFSGCWGSVRFQSSFVRHRLVPRSVR